MDPDPVPERDLRRGPSNAGSCDAEVAEIDYTAFASKKNSKRVTARLLVRRVKRLNPTSTDGSEQGEPFAAYRYHAVFTDSALELVQAEAIHRGHPIIEQVIAEFKGGPLAHLRSSRFNANGAWFVLAINPMDPGSIRVTQSSDNPGDMTRPRQTLLPR